MPTVNEFRVDFNQVLGDIGEMVRFRYFNTTAAAAGSYDDIITLAQSGNDLWTTGLHHPINATRGSSDAVLVEQGRVLNTDSKLYINGSIATSGVFRVGIGSPTPRSEYGVVEGVISWSVMGSPVYKMMYIRALPTGSLEGE